MTALQLNDVIDALTEQFRSNVAPMIAHQAYASARMLISPANLNPSLTLTQPRTMFRNPSGHLPFVVILTGQQLLTKECFLLFFERPSAPYDAAQADPFELRVFTCSPKHDASEQQLVTLDPVLELEVQRQLKTYFHEPLEHIETPPAISGLRYLSIIDLDPASLPPAQE